MQRRNPIKPSGSKQPNIDEALSKPEDEALFYTASVQFLKQRLEEKSKVIDSKKQTSQSCCEFKVDPELAKTVTPKIISPEDSVESMKLADELSMQQVLPFPKSNRHNFFSRLWRTLRKCRKSVDLEDMDEIENYISKFKFPESESCSGELYFQSSVLQIISEESLDTHQSHHSTSTN